MGEDGAHFRREVLLAGKERAERLSSVMQQAPLEPVPRQLSDRNNDRAPTLPLDTAVPKTGLERADPRVSDGLLQGEEQLSWLETLLDLETLLLLDVREVKRSDGGVGSVGSTPTVDSMMGSLNLPGVLRAPVPEADGEGPLMANVTASSPSGPSPSGLSRLTGGGTPPPGW